MPQTEVFRLRAARGIAYRETGNLDDARLDSVNEAEVAHQPGERRTFRVAAALNVKGRGGQVNTHADTTRLIERIQTPDPHGRFFPVGLGPLEVFASEVVSIERARA